MRFLIACTALLLSVLSAAAEPKPRGDRWLGVGVTDPKDKDYEKAFTEAQGVGMRHLVLSFDWRDLETKPGVFAPSPDFLEIANAWYPPRKVPVHLMIRPLHTNQDARPEHLKGKPFDAPEMIASFKALLDWIFSRCPDLEIPSISIGSESDIWLGEDEAKWTQFGAFLRETAAHARKLRPGIRVASEATYAAFSGKAEPRLRALVAHCDVVGASHYPVNESFAAAKPAEIREVFRKVAAFAGRKPVFFYQLGYPSGEGCRSSEARQAEFIREMFAAWDAHAVAIPFVNLTWSEDIPKEAVEGYTKYYQFDAPGFRDFLGSLGMRHAGGKAKEAWGALKAESEKRGW
jgi:hypothetical protein